MELYSTYGALQTNGEEQMIMECFVSGTFIVWQGAQRWCGMAGTKLTIAGRWRGLLRSDSRGAHSPTESHSCRTRAPAP